MELQHASRGLLSNPQPSTLNQPAYTHTPQKQAYKALKAILSASLLSHIDPATNTNPFFARLGYVPGNALKDSTAGAGPAHPMAAEQEEVLASATIHLPGVLAATGSAAAAQVGTPCACGCLACQLDQGVWQWHIWHVYCFHVDAFIDVLHTC